MTFLYLWRIVCGTTWRLAVVFVRWRHPLSLCMPGQPKIPLRAGIAHRHRHNMGCPRICAVVQVCRGCSCFGPSQAHSAKCQHAARTQQIPRHQFSIYPGGILHWCQRALSLEKICFSLGISASRSSEEKAGQDETFEFHGIFCSSF